MSAATVTPVHVLVTCAQMQHALPDLRAGLDALALEIHAPELTAQQFSEEELIAMLPGMSAIIAGDDPLSRRVIESASDLRIVVKWGIGMDAIDLQAARDHQLVVRNTPMMFGDEVADSAFAYVLMLARGHHLIDQAVREGRWPKHAGRTLSGSRLGLIGFGSIGRATAARGRAFGMDCVAADPYADTGSHTDADARIVELEELLRTADFIVLTCPLTDETFHLLDEAALALVKPDAIVVNVGRGPLVDEPALISALAQGRIAGAGLDVFEVEPLPPESPLRSMSNVVLGAHNGSNTAQGVRRASARAAEILSEEIAGLRGRST